MIIGRRRSRVVGAIWGLVALGFLAAAALLWIDQQRVSFEVPAFVAAALLSRAFWRQRAELDRHGINTRGGVGERRLLWAGIDRVEVRRTSWIRPAIILQPKGDGPAIPVPASAGLRRRQRNRLLEFLADLSRQHGFELVTVNGDLISSTRPEPPDVVLDRVLAAAAGERIFPGADPADAAAAEPSSVPAVLDEASVEAVAVDRPAVHPQTPPWLVPEPTSPTLGSDPG